MIGVTGATGATGPALYTANFVVSAQSGAGAGNGDFVMTGAGLTPLSLQPYFGVMVPIACNTVTLSTAVTGNAPSTPYTISVNELLTGSGASFATGLQCQAGSGSGTCTQTIGSMVQAGNVLQVQFSGNVVLNTWVGAVYATLTCQ